MAISKDASQLHIGKVDSINYLKRFQSAKSWKNFIGTNLGGSLVRRNRRTLSSYFVPASFPGQVQKGNTIRKGYVFFCLLRSEQ